MFLCDTYLFLCVYFIANLSLSEIRRMYFKFKNEVFMQKIGDILLPDSQIKILENILKKEVGEHTTLGSQNIQGTLTSITDSSHCCCHTHRVLITATDMRVTPMKLVFFNNYYEIGPHGIGNV